MMAQVLHNEHESTPIARHIPKEKIHIVHLDSADDEEQQEGVILADHHSSPSKERVRTREEFAILKKLVLLLGNIFAWYYTNGMNGIAMQSFAARVRVNNGDNEQQLDLGSNIAIITVTTALQLGIGALIGWGITSTMVLAQIWRPHGRTWSISRDTVLLGGLHSIGSVATNLGFMYGKASVIQIIKLLEPFETLFLSQLLIPEDGKWSVGIVSSMIFVTSAAVSLLHIRPEKPHPFSVLFAVLSGLTLSLRNVLQRKQYAQVQQGDKSDEGDTASKVQKSVMSFTKLSLDSFVMTTVPSFIVNGFLLVASPGHRATMTLVVFRGFHGDMFAWHPLYNTFSMITLGFCSALTHSLLNAGKRVSAIVMAIIWFHEEITSATVMGLVAVAAGGCWYTVESRSKKKTTRMVGVFKFVVSLLLVRALFEFQSLTSIMKAVKAS